MVPLLNGLNQILFVFNSVISNIVFTKCTVYLWRTVWRITYIDICLNSSAFERMGRKKKSDCNHVFKLV